MNSKRCIIVYMKELKLNYSDNKKGFTIIEVVLVLAIAGLIFLMVFLALPALQRSQRDSQRKNQVNAVAGQLNNAISNNRGRLISDYGSNNDFENFIANYITPFQDEYRDPSTGEVYVFRECEAALGCGVSGGNISTSIEQNLQVGEIYYNAGANCSNGGQFVDVPENRTYFALVTRMEGGGLLCVSNG